jgi:hypothetical protein
MRKASWVAIVALVMFTGLMPATAASASAAPRVRWYEGTTSQGGRLSMSVAVRDGVPYLGWLIIDGPYSCEDGTQGDIAGDGWGWFPSDLAGPVPTNEPLELSENEGDFAFMLSGRIGPLRGSGTLTVLIPALTEDEQAAQVCTFGGTWAIERSDTSFSLEPAMTVQAVGSEALLLEGRLIAELDPVLNVKRTRRAGFGVGVGPLSYPRSSGSNPTPCTCVVQSLTRPPTTARIPPPTTTSRVGR